jgi:hypothetical protein
MTAEDFESTVSEVCVGESSERERARERERERTDELF